MIAQRRLNLISQQTGRELRLSDSAVAVLSEYPWPGNVRELVNALERAAVMSPGEVLEPSSFIFPKPRNAAPGITSIDDHIRETLRRFSGTMELQEIADRLGLSRKTLWEKKKKWAL